jgi:hypothetical protein
MSEDKPKVIRPNVAIPPDCIGCIYSSRYNTSNVGRCNACMNARYPRKDGIDLPYGFEGASE